LGHLSRQKLTYKVTSQLTQLTKFQAHFKRKIVSEEQMNVRNDTTNERGEA